MANEFVIPNNMTTYSVKKFDKVVFSLSAIIPWTLLVSVTVFYLHASFILGYNPTFANPDPKDLKIYSFSLLSNYYPSRFAESIINSRL